MNLCPFSQYLRVHTQHLQIHSPQPRSGSHLNGGSSHTQMAYTFASVSVPPLFIASAEPHRIIMPPAPQIHYSACASFCGNSSAPSKPRAVRFSFFLRKNPRPPRSGPSISSREHGVHMQGSAFFSSSASISFTITYAFTRPGSKTVTDLTETSGRLPSDSTRSLFRIAKLPGSDHRRCRLFRVQRVFV